MSFKCKYGHTHRTESGMQYCHVNIPWTEKAKYIVKTPWEKDGTTEIWSNLGNFRDLFWRSMRDRIVLRDKKCQYDECNETTDLEVHHIIPRQIGGSDHPENLITLCHNHHRIQSSHHYDVGLILNDADIQTTKYKLIRQARPKSESTLLTYGI